MTSKKQKRMAGEARQQEMDAAHEAQIRERQRIADNRARRRRTREMEQQRHASALAAIKKMKGGGDDAA